MRFKLTLQIQPEVMGRELPINYQYPLQGVIYHTLEKSDLQFSTWLHENGYQMNGKRFKLFTFSNLIVPQYGIDKQRERLIVKSDFVTLYITFLPEKSTQQFIQGLFQQQTIQIALRGHGCPYCSSHRVMKGYNDLESQNPTLAKEWDYDRNTSSPSDVTVASGKKVWWRCSKGHEWEATISKRSN